MVSGNAKEPPMEWSIAMQDATHRRGTLLVAHGGRCGERCRKQSTGDARCWSHAARGGRRGERRRTQRTGDTHCWSHAVADAGSDGECIVPILTEDPRGESVREAGPSGMLVRPAAAATGSEAPS